MFPLLVTLLRSVLAERHSEVAQQSAPFLVGYRRGHNRNIQPPDFINFVEVYLREVDLLLDTESIASAAVECARAYSTKVTHPGQNRVHQPIQEFIHSFATQRNRYPDRHTRPQLERGY